MMDVQTNIAQTEKVPTMIAEKSVTTSIESAETQAFNPQATKKLVRKIDWHLIPFLSLIYLYAITRRQNSSYSHRADFPIDSASSTVPTSETLDSTI